MAERSADNDLYDNHGELILTGSSNAYVATVARSTGGYHLGLRLCGKANHTNNGASTLNLVTPNSPSGIGAVAIRKAGNAALVGGEIVSGKYYDFLYDATNSVFQLQNPDIGTGAISTALIADDAVTNAKLANMAESTIKGRAAGAGTGDPTDLTATQATAILNAFTDALKGLVPASGGGTTTFLRADATFAAPVSIVTAVAQGAVSAAATLDIALGSADMYEIDLINLLPATDNVNLFARFSQSSSFLSGASDYRWGRHTFDARVTDASDSEIEVTSAVGNVAGEGATLTIRIFKPSTAVFNKVMRWQGVFVSTTPEMINDSGGGQLIANTDAIDGVRFLFSSGDIASGYYAVRSYGFT